jgi:high-affinity Fe2+/Pb2+ permease
MNMGDAGNAPKLLGLFPVNVLHNVVHLLFGVWGLLAARTYAGAQAYCKLGGVIYLVLAVCGLIIPTTFGLIPIGGNDVWLHAVLGIVLAGVGFTAKEEAGFATAAA